MQCYKLETIDISSPCLKTFCIIDCFKLVEVKIDTPKLRVFGYGGDLISFSSNGLVLAKADLDIDSRNIDTQWFVRYIEFLSQMHQFCKAFDLRSQTGKNVIIPSEVREIIRSPLFGVCHLNFKMHDHKSFPLSDIVDGLMWILPHVESISIEYEDAYWDKPYIEFAYNKELIYEGKSRIPLCCQSVPVSCWQHCIKEVKLGHARISRGRTVVVERYMIEFHVLADSTSINNKKVIYHTKVFGTWFESEWEVECLINFRAR
ncbi:F-box/LRR-repeat protein [Melia azedarach]|nr:F-box/LRR-repeat protein [Melia azedarach]